MPGQNQPPVTVMSQREWIAREVNETFCHSHFFRFSCFFVELGGCRTLDSVFLRPQTSVCNPSGVEIRKNLKILCDPRFIAQSAKKWIPCFTSRPPADIQNGGVS